MNEPKLELIRKPRQKWIIDKNVSSSKLLVDIVKIAKEKKKGFKFQQIVDSIAKDEKKASNVNGKKKQKKKSQITIGVRLLQSCFYMLGYTVPKSSNSTKKVFVPASTTSVIIDSDDPIEVSKNHLVNFFGLQYPHPFSRTPKEFNILFGRLITKLLLDEKIDQKLYIDECIWFLPFIRTIISETYDCLIQDILDYRKLSYDEKLQLFKQVPGWQKLFGNICHEMNYYLLRLFNDFGVFEITKDENHNQGKVFRFKQTETCIRSDAYQSRASCSGYLSLHSQIKDFAQILVDSFSAFDLPLTMDFYGADSPLTRSQWITQLYRIQPLKYLTCIGYQSNAETTITHTISRMTESSVHGTKDGKEFEYALRDLMKLFVETKKAQRIGGSGNPDVVCYLDIDNQTSCIIIEAKTREHGNLGVVESTRVESHIDQKNAEFCIIVAPGFATKVDTDIANKRMVTIEAEIFGSYCEQEFYSIKTNKLTQTNVLHFQPLYAIATKHLGEDITPHVKQYIEEKYGIEII